MKLMVIYRPNSEHGRKVEEFAREYTRMHGGKVELVHVDGREGSAMASLYDITRYPGILALRDDGSSLMVWQGEDLPLMSEVASYALV